MDTEAPLQPAPVAPAPAPARQDPPRPAADVVVRRILRIRDGDACSLTGARNAFSASVGISAVRCLITYIALPLLRPVVDLSGGVGPALGLLVGTVSAVAIVISMRRFWAADHRMRWGYTAIGGGILAFLAVAAVIDVAALAR